MKFSIMYSFVVPPGAPMTHLDTFREMDRLLPLAEELGYHGFHTTEHHFQSNGWAPSPLAVLAHAAGQTSRMRLATNIMIPALNHPVRLLEDLLTLDNLSNGRLVMGTSPGYVVEEFAAYGIRFEDRFRLHEEIIDFIQAAWANPTDIGFQGKLLQVPSADMMPRPVQARLPIWYGVSGPKLLERAAKRRVPITASPRHALGELEEHFRLYDEVAAKHGYVPEERPVIRETFVADTQAEAERLAGPAVEHMFGLYARKSGEGVRGLYNDNGDLVTDAASVKYQNFQSRYMIGDPARMKDDVDEIIARLNPTEIVLRMQLPGIPTEALERSIRLFAEKVMPYFSG